MLTRRARVVSIDAIARVKSFLPSAVVRDACEKNFFRDFFVDLTVDHAMFRHAIFSARRGRTARRGEYLDPRTRARTDCGGRRKQ